MTAASSSSSSSDPFGTPGFRFYPTEEELLSFYLRHRLANTRPQIERVIPVVDVYSHHPSDLRSLAGEASVRDTEQWFFFCPRAEREVHGSRPARTTPSGYWKATGSPSCVFSSSANKVVGVKRTMVFYQGRTPTGTKTRWKMNEYKAVADDADAAAAAAPAMASLRLRNEFSVCRVYISTGTLRSFDRRPLNPAGHNQAVHQHVPSSARAANTNLADDVIVSTGQAENSHDSSSLGSRGIVDVDGSEDGAIDWNSLITTADDFSFDINFNSLITTADDFSFDINFNSSIIGAWPQI